MCMIFGPMRTVSLEPLAHRRNLAILNLLYSCYFKRYSYEQVEFVALPYSGWRSTYCSNRFMTFLSQFLDVITISMSTVSFIAQLDSGILCLQNAFFWSMI